MVTCLREETITKTTCCYLLRLIILFHCRTVLLLVLYIFIYEYSFKIILNFNIR